MYRGGSFTRISLFPHLVQTVLVNLSLNPSGSTSLSSSSRVLHSRHGLGIYSMCSWCARCVVNLEDVLQKLGRTI
jgi:hypothetical protein